MTFEMRRQNHAISEFTATIELFKEIGSETFIQAKKTAADLAEKLELPVPVNHQTVQVSLGPEMVASPIPIEAIGYQRFAPDGEVDKLFICEQNKLIVTLHSYVSWDETKQLLRTIFEPLLNIYQKDVPAIKNITLQYINEFRGTTPHHTSTNEILRPESKWVPSFCKDTLENWHTHGGVFVPNGDSRFLINVNLDVKSAHFFGVDYPVPILNNLILIRLGYDLPGKPPLILDTNDSWAMLENHFDQVHTLEKDTLYEIFSDKYLQKIGALNA